MSINQQKEFNGVVKRMLKAAVLQLQAQANQIIAIKAVLLKNGLLSEAEPVEANDEK